MLFVSPCERRLLGRPTTEGAEARHVSLGKQLCVLQARAERRDVCVLQCSFECIENKTVGAVSDSVNILRTE